MATPATANRPTRMRVTKSAADKPANAASKRSTIAPSRPVVARSRSFERSSVSRNSGSLGRKKPRCCDDGAMAAVNPVEIADGQHRAVERVVGRRFATDHDKGVGWLRLVGHGG